MSPILLHLLVAALYGGLAWHVWRSRWRGPALAEPVRGMSTGERVWLLIALLVHGWTLAGGIFGGEPVQMRFGFSLALSTIMWLAIGLYWIESHYARMEGLLIFGLPTAALCVLLPLVWPSQHLLLHADSAIFRGHFLVAMLAYSLFALAALHAILMAIAEKQLHRGRLTPFFASLPPLLTMEALLFRIIHLAFGLLTLTLLTGFLFAETMFGRAWRFDHKTVFALISWLIFAFLVAGRHWRGWRGRTALRFTLAGFLLLMLAYVGSRFVLEVLLGRPA